MKLPSLALAILMTSLVGCSSAGLHPPKTVEHLDLSRYAGHWYEIARIPKSYEKGCVNSTADYAPLANGKLKVVNTCNAGGKVKKVEGVATVVDKVNHSKLKVKFGWASGDYWVFYVNEDYTAALVGTPDFKGLWVLGRRPTMSGQQYEGLLHVASDKGFDTSRVRRTEQSQQGD
jgi:apolipoprotein D and lipocalin family protein